MVPPNRSARSLVDCQVTWNHPTSPSVHVDNQISGNHPTSTSVHHNTNNLVNCQVPWNHPTSPSVRHDADNLIDCQFPENHQTSLPLFTIMEPIYYATTDCFLLKVPSIFPQCSHLNGPRVTSQSGWWLRGQKSCLVIGTIVKWTTAGGNWESWRIQE